MTIYIYKAINNDGKSIGGKMSAVNEEELASKLRQSNLELLSSSEQQIGSFGLWRSVSIKELILICVHIHQLEKAGVSILDSIADLRDSTDSPVVKTVLMDVYDALKNGKLLSAAMASHPNVFDQVFVGLVAAGEKTGSFSEVFEHLEHHLRWVMNTKKKIKKATYYPLFLLVLMTAVTIIMMVYVVPKLTVFLVMQNIALPWYTRWLMGLSDFILGYWYLLIIIPILTYGGLKAGSHYSKKFTNKIDALKLKIPYIGKILMKIELARFCRFFAVTYKSGMSILECLYISGNVIGNSSIRDSIDRVATAVGEGARITESLSTHGHFPTMVLRMFRVGEESGNMDGTLKHINDFYDREVDEAIDELVAVLQPILTLLMGGLLLWITISVFGPVYSSFGGTGVS